MITNKGWSISRSTAHWLKFLHLDGARGWVFVAICGLILLLECFGEAGRELLRYERAAVLDGEWWRFLTAHLVHLGWSHLALNLIGLALMWALFQPDYSPGRWCWILLVSICAIDAGFLFIRSDLLWYVGLSGLLHGVMAAGALAHWRRREPDAWILFLFLIGKLIWEQFNGAMPYSVHSAGGPVVVDAHLYGAIGAVIAVLCLRLRRMPV